MKRKKGITLGAVLAAVLLVLVGSVGIPELTAETEGQLLSVTPIESGTGQGNADTPAGSGAGQGISDTQTENGAGQGSADTQTENGAGQGISETPTGSGAGQGNPETPTENGAGQSNPEALTLEQCSAFDGSTPYVALNNNEPYFAAEMLTTIAYEQYAALDALGRCGAAVACIGQELMPTEARESISHIKPSGWQVARYDFVDGQSLYNRCHLIGFQLAGENANERNLITGTRYMNTEGMLPFENLIADYVKETGNHVMYRVTPIFEGEELVARGVQMEAFSVEDDGDGVCFHVYAYNNQPNIVIDYATGDNWLADTAQTEGKEPPSAEQEQTYVLNTSSRKFHVPSCDSVETIKKENQETVTVKRSELIEQGYTPCGACAP